MIKPQILKQDSNLNRNNILHILIFKRNINTQSLSPKSPRIPKKTNDLNVPNISPTSDNTNQEAIDYAIEHINQNNPNFTVRVKRKSLDTLSDQGPSGENALNKKAKFSHENENDNENTILDNIEFSHENENTIIESIELNAPEFENQMRNLAINMELHAEVKDEAFRLIDEIQSTITLLDEYMANIKTRIVEVEESIYARHIDINDLESDADMPRLMSDESLSSESSHSHSNDWEINSEQDPDNNPDLNILDLEDIDEAIVEANFNEDTNFDQNNITLDNNYLVNDGRIFNPLPSDNSSVVDINVGMEPLDNGVPFNEVIYSGQMRSDNIIYNNYSIHMSGNDNIDYRMAYEYLTECLDGLNKLIIEHQALIALEREITPVTNQIIAQAMKVEWEISSILEILSHFN